MYKLLAIVLLLILILVFVYVITQSSNVVVGGGMRVTSPHVVVDTLNYIGTVLKKKSFGKDSIVKAIDTLSPKLHKKYPGNIYYAMKGGTYVDGADRHFHQDIKDAVVRNRVYAVDASEYDPQFHTREHHNVRKEVEKREELQHATKGRDDYLCAYLAHNMKCGVITNDNYNDFSDLRVAVEPFIAREITFWTDREVQHYINPRDLPDVKKPRRIKIQ